MSEHVSEAEATKAVDPQTVKKVAVAALVGTALEWYDFFLFTTASALVFNVQYFVSGDPVVSTMEAFGTLAVGFVARPIGGLIFGHLGDKYGRRLCLMVTIIGIGAVTALIGLLPNYMSIGMAAPIFLIALRILQGLAVGGEWSGAVTIAVEHAPIKQRARFAAMPQLGSPIGTLLSSGGFFLVVFLSSQASFDAWGWRIPFLLSIPFLLISVLIRRSLSESPVFNELLEAGEKESAPIKQVLIKTPIQLVLGIAVALLGIGGFYLVTTFVISYGTQTLGLSSQLMLFGTLIAAALEIPVLLYGGRLGERFGASRVAIWGGVVSAAVAYPAFLLVETKNPVLVVVGMTVAVAALSFPYAASGTILTGLFPARLRYTGVAISSNMAGVVSGFVPLIATAVVAAAGQSYWPAALMLVIISLITATAVCWHRG